MNSMMVRCSLVGFLALVLPGEVWCSSVSNKNPVAVMDEVRRLAGLPLWPGFSALDYPTAIYSGEETLLFGHPQPPEGFVEHGDFPGVWIFPGRHPAMRSNSKAKIGGVSTATLLLTINPERPLVEEASIVIHETFHIFQETQLPRWRPNELFRFTYPVSNRENYALSILEDHALAHALEATETLMAMGWAKAAMDFRSRRTAALSEEHRTFEQGLENMEGTAFYVAHLALGESNSTKTLLNILPPERFRWRFYATGGALAALLDRFERGWKEVLKPDSSATLGSILRKSLTGKKLPSVVFSPEEHAVLSNDAGKAIKRLLQERNGYRRIFSETGQWRVRIIASGDEPLKIDKFDAISIMGFEHGELLHGRLLTLTTPTARVQMNNPGYVRREFKGLKALTSASPEDPILGRCREVLFAGFDEEPSVEIETGRVTIRAPGFQADFTGTAVEREGSAWILRLAEAQ